MKLIFICISSLFLMYNSLYQVNTQKVINTENYTTDELTKLEKLREITGDILEMDYMKTNNYLIRWLRARNMNVALAGEKLKQAIKWKHENNVNDILNEIPIPEFVRNPFYSMDSVDREKRPVFMILDMKKIDTRKFALSGHTKQFIRAWIQIYERIEKKIYNIQNSTNQNSAQGVLLCNLQNYSLRQHACLACIPLFYDNTNMLESYYPGLFQQIILINTPRIFSPLLDLLKPLMSPTTINSLVVYENNKEKWQPKLFEQISPDQLPLQLGGRKE